MSRIITIIGKRGYGKTTLCKNIANDSLYKDILINDYIGEYSNLSLPDKEIYIVNNRIDLLIKFAWSRGDCLLVLDEVDLYGKNNKAIEFIYRYGRHKNIEIVAVSRRFYDLPVIIRALTDYFFIFRITEKRDLEYLSRYIDNSRIEKIKSLPKYTFEIIKL
jgi:predicted AAA+ superfamily ATPase